jgi:hypothetical protein
MGDAYNSAAAAAEIDRARQKVLHSTCVELELIGLTEHGQRYRVTYAGDTLVEGHSNPITGKVQARFWAPQPRDENLTFTQVPA